MKITQVILLVTLIIFSAIITVSAEEKQSAVIESISFESNGAHGETVNFKLNGKHLPKIFAIKGEKPRVVLDFPDTSYSGPDSTIKAGGDLVKGIRIGIHNDPVSKIRVVIDISPGTTFSYDQNFIGTENILTVSVSSAEKVKAEVDVQPVKEEKIEQKPEQKAEKKAEQQVEQKSDQHADKKTEQQVEQKLDQTPEKKTEPQAEQKSDQISQEKTTAVPEKKIILKQEKGKQVFAVDEKEVKEDKPAPPVAESAVYPSVDEVFVPEKKKEVPESAEATEKTEPASDQAVASAPVLLDVSFDGTSNKGEMVKFRLNEFYPPVVFGIEKENPRVICDFLNTTLSDKVELEIASKGVYVDHIKTEKQHNPEKVRVILDLMPNKNYDLQQVFFKEDNLFVIIVNSFEKTEEPKK